VYEEDEEAAAVAFGPRQKRWGCTARKRRKEGSRQIATEGRG